ncbi:DUF4282 domain-containing protein [Marinimicrobium sp. LS-A18]|uniref:DUF4282 domain-containing protein n=1 Tax=Marinimicrobium sp. LS-A18 TaxID=1381596 RepID=UPI000463E819|nr:DUF4282 domain-containing protein [Marinimicrobium sp. LS-A18]
MSVSGKDLFFFDRMLTPSIITVVYWLLLLSVLVGGIGMMFGQSFFAGLGIIVFGAVGVRIWCELLIVLFKIHQNLKAIADKP